MNNTGTRRCGRELLISLIVCAVLVAFDQWTKALATTHLQDAPFVIWEGVFEFRYLTNKGAAFGVFQNQITYFLISTVITLALIAYVYWRMPHTKQYGFLRGVLVLLTAGAIGNFIDRAFLGYVVDFLYFKLIDFPIFNVADCYICVAAFFLFVAIVFLYKDDDFAWLFPEKESKKEERA